MATINILPEGFMFDDRYKVIRLIGQGGMGIVYLAQDTKLNNALRALKTIRPELLSNRKNAAQFKNEALAAMNLAHRNIVKVYNYEEWQSMSYIVMEYVDGPPLTQYLVDQKKLTLEQFMLFSEQICEALQFAHEEGILHQDIKPDNIFVNSEGIAKLADFGIARILADAATRLTGAVPSGTIAYMSPEIINGAEPEIRSDVYMLGVTFFEMLKGDPPFMRGDIFRQHLEKDPGNIPGIPEALNSAIQKALAKDPTGRPASAKEFLNEIHQSLAAAPRKNPVSESRENRPVVIDRRRFTTTDSPQYEESKTPGRKTNASVTYKQAVEAFNAGEFEEAISLFQKTISQDEALKDIIYPKIIECKAEINRLERQKESKLRLKRERERVPVYLITAKEHREKGQIQEAYAWYRQILDVDPENKEAREAAAALKKDVELLEQKQKAKYKSHPIKNWVPLFVIVVIFIILLIAFQVNPKPQSRDIDSGFEEFALNHQDSIILRIEENMAPIPKGKITAKDEDGEEYTISLDSDILVNRFEVTQQEYVAIMGKDSNKSPQKGARLPVVNVSWYEARDFCEKLSRITGKKYRLPTTEEWEYACRAGSGSTYFWGDSNSQAQRYAWFAENSEGKIQRIGQKQQNKWRLHDICGNVWEWCSDAVKTNSKRWKADETYRSIRGGSIASNTEALKASLFAEQTKAKNSVDIGFRIAREADKPKATSEEPSAANAINPAVTSEFTAAEKKNITNLLQLVRIPSGSFTMGSREGYPDESPPHKVAISRPFWIGKYEVTQELYELVMKANPSSFKSPQRPVDTVSWEEAMAFCKKISELTGDKYRLPTEAEWEYACRGGSSTRFYWGNDKNQASKHAWYNDNSQLMTHDVGQKGHNNWGLYDINGNVAEWCMDIYDKFYYSGSPRRDPLCRKGDTIRVHRGGSWTTIGSVLTSSKRSSNTEYYHYYDLGFRLVKEIPRSEIPGKENKKLKSMGKS